MDDALGGIALRIGVFRFTIAPVQPLAVPAVNKANMLRGGFGHAFRRLCCVPQCRDTKQCPLADSCPYKAVFEPSPPPDADRLSKNQDIPRPFVFRAPLDVFPSTSLGEGEQSRTVSAARVRSGRGATKTRYEPGEQFEFGLVLIGRALDFLPYFVLSFRELAQEGLGLNRAKCTLERVEELKPGDRLQVTGDRQRETTEDPESFHPVPPASGIWNQESGSVSPVSYALSPVPYCLSPFPVPCSLFPVAHDLSPLTSLVYSAEDQLFRSTGSCSAADWVKTRLRQLGNREQGIGIREQETGNRVVRSSLSPVTCSLSPALGSRHSSLVTVSFLTPTFLRADGEVVRRPEFHHLFKRLRDRINALCTFFGDGPLDVDFRGLGERAEKVRTLSAQIDWVERFRTSSKTHQRHALSGFVGSCTYDFSSVDRNLSPVPYSLAPDFLPWLALGELVHVGKHTAWGNGWYQVRGNRP